MLMLHPETLFPNNLYFSRDINDDDLENDIREAFRCFDKDALGYIPVPSRNIMSYSIYCCYHVFSSVELTQILETLGEKLSPEESQVRRLERIFVRFVFRR